MSVTILASRSALGGCSFGALDQPPCAVHQRNPQRRHRVLGQASATPPADDRMGTGTSDRERIACHHRYDISSFEPGMPIGVLRIGHERRSHQSLPIRTARGLSVSLLGYTSEIPIRSWRQDMYYLRVPVDWTAQLYRPGSIWRSTSRGSPLLVPSDPANPAGVAMDTCVAMRSTCGYIAGGDDVVMRAIRQANVVRMSPDSLIVKRATAAALTEAVGLRF